MTKITSLAAAALPLHPTDLVEVVQQVSTTPVNKKVPVSELGVAPELASTSAAPGAVDCAAGATVTLLAWNLTPTKTTLLTLSATGTVFGTTGSHNAAGFFRWRVGGSEVGASFRWHTNGVERQAQVSTAAQALLVAGVATTIQLEGSNDAGSGQTMNYREMNAARHEVTF